MFHAINIVSDDSFMSEVGGEFKSKEWKDTGLEFVYKPKEWPVEFEEKKDNYTDQPLLYFYTFSGKFTGYLSLYILE